MRPPRKGNGSIDTGLKILVKYYDKAYDKAAQETMLHANNTEEGVHMKTVCLRQELTAALMTVGKDVAARPATPVLSGIYIKASETSIEMRSTDNELSVIATIPANSSEEGAIVVAGKYFQDVVKNLPDDEVAIECDKDENVVKIRSGGSSFTLLSMETKDFPDIRKTEGEINFSISSPAMKALIKKTSFACAVRQDARPIFTGCLIELMDENISMVATNTHRLSICRDTLDAPIREFDAPEEDDPAAPSKIYRYIVPKRAIEELFAALPGEVPTDVNVVASKSEISFSFGDMYIASRLIEGQFPDYNRAVPKSFNTRVKVPFQEFLSAVNRVSLITRSTNYNYETMEFTAGNIRMTANNPDIGRAEESVRAETDVPDVKISFNVTYIVDVLKNIGGENFYFHLNETLKPAVMKEEGSDSFLCVVTPVRTQGM